MALTTQNETDLLALLAADAAKTARITALETANTAKTASITALNAKVAALEKNTGLAADEEESEAEAPETPTDTITRGGVGYKFAVPTFRYNKVLYISADEVANTTLIDALITKQTSGGVFYPGIMKKA